MNEMFQKARSLASAVGYSAAAFLTLASFQTAQAAGTYDGITGAVDWSEVTTGIVAVAALIATVLVVKRGSGMLLRVIGR